MTTPVVSVGIDVGKSKLDVSCLRQDRTSVHEVFSNNSKGVTLLQTFLKRQGTAPTVPCTLESTGSYHYLVSLRLRDAGRLVNCVNPIITKKYMKASIRDAKSDTIDARRIAEIGFLEPNLQRFTTTRENIGATARLSSLEHIERILQQLKAHVRYLDELKETIGVSVPHPHLVRAIDNLGKQIDTLRAHVCAVAPEEAKMLARSIPGLSEQQAATILLALGDKQFTDRDQLVAFVGLDCRVRQSGSWQGKQHISKRGDGYLRKQLYQIAWSLYMNNERFHSIYQKKRDEGKHHKTCLIVVARKFLHFLFAYYWRKSLVLEISTKRRTRIKKLILPTFNVSPIPIMTVA